MDEHAVVTTRRSLHAVAERLLAGPQYREHGEIRLQVTPGGFGQFAGPLRVEGDRDGRRRRPGAAARHDRRHRSRAGCRGGRARRSLLRARRVRRGRRAGRRPGRGRAAARLVRARRPGAAAVRSVRGADPLARALRPGHRRRRGQLRGVARRRRPPTAVRLRRTVDAPRRGLLERAVRRRPDGGASCPTPTPSPRSSPRAGTPQADGRRARPSSGRARNVRRSVPTQPPRTRRGTARTRCSRWTGP